MEKDAQINIPVSVEIVSCEIDSQLHFSAINLRADKELLDNYRDLFFEEFELERLKELLDKLRETRFLNCTGTQLQLLTINSHVYKLWLCHQTHKLSLAPHKTDFLHRKHSQSFVFFLISPFPFRCSGSILAFFERLNYWVIKVKPLISFSSVPQLLSAWRISGIKAVRVLFSPILISSFAAL